MATSTIAKSVFRNTRNICVGFGEVPALDATDNLGWGLPGGQVTQCEKEATAWATKLDQVIKKSMKSVSQLARSTTFI